MEKKSTKKIIGIILLILGIGLAGFGGYNYLMNDNNQKEENKEEDKNEDNKKDENKEDEQTVTTKYPEEKEVIGYNGVYTFNNGTIKLFTYDGTNYTATIQKDTSQISFGGEFENNKLEEVIFENSYSLEIGDGYVTFETNEEGLSGKYTKTKDYLMTDYFADTFGSAKYIYNEYNGIYQLDNMKIKIFQGSEDELTVICEGEYGNTNETFEISNGKFIYDDFFGDAENIEISFSDGKVTLNVTTDDADYSLKSGTYTRISDYKLIDILKDNYM